MDRACMGEVIEADICVIGGGSGGLSVAAGAAQLGARTVLIEAGRMGGDCLNVGCVPSKSLIAAARQAHAMRSGAPFGIAPVAPQVDMAAVKRHIEGVIASIAPHDSVERFEGLGVRVIKDHGRFLGPDMVIAGDTRIKARRFVIATGSRPAVPPVAGLDQVPFFTNETIFANDSLPDHLVVLGGGPIGCELAQAYRRLGSRVTIIDIGPILPKDDPELVAVVRRSLLADGIEVLDQVEVHRAEPGPAIVATVDGRERRIAGSHLLVATGRRPNLEELGLDVAGIGHGKAGITVDGGLRTTNRKVYAIGDVAGGLQFTHVASYHAGLVIRSALFRLPGKAKPLSVPRVTYVDPELAAVGLSEADAAAQGVAHEVVRWPMADNDRARTDRTTDGLLKLVIGKRGRVLGAAMAGAHAGELILPWVMAVQRQAKASAMASVVAPYPTLAEAGKRAAGAYYTPRLFSPRMRRLVKLLGWLG